MSSGRSRAFRSASRSRGIGERRHAQQFAVGHQVDFLGSGLEETGGVLAFGLQGVAGMGAFLTAITRRFLALKFRSGG